MYNALSASPTPQTSWVSTDGTKWDAIPIIQSSDPLDRGLPPCEYYEALAWGEKEQMWVAMACEHPSEVTGKTEYDIYLPGADLVNAIGGGSSGGGGGGGKLDFPDPGITTEYEAPNGIKYEWDATQEHWSSTCD